MACDSIGAITSCQSWGKTQKNGRRGCIETINSHLRNAKRAGNPTNPFQLAARQRVTCTRMVVAETILALHWAALQLNVFLDAAVKRGGETA